MTLLIDDPLRREDGNACKKEGKKGKFLGLKQFPYRKKSLASKKFLRRFLKQENSLRERSELNTLIIVGLRRGKISNINYVGWKMNKLFFPSKTFFLFLINFFLWENYYY